MRRNKTVIFYGMPAYGHINSTLYLVEQMTNWGYRVIYYALDEFKELIEDSGGEYRAYPIDGSQIDLTDGKKLFRFYRILAEYTWNMAETLIREAGQVQPVSLFFDSTALWGRVTAFALGIPSVSFYSILSAGRLGSRAFLSYMPGFAAGFLRYIGELPAAVSYCLKLRRRYHVRKLDLLSVLMNRGDWNVMAYSRQFQPGGAAFGENYFFLGPPASYRRQELKDDFDIPEGELIYISLGTIFQSDKELLREIFGRFGGSRFNVVLILPPELEAEMLPSEPMPETRTEEPPVPLLRNGTEEPPVLPLRNGTEEPPVPLLRNEIEESPVPRNFIIRSYVNQGEVMKRASLFITAGGLNSIHEALVCGVPCLLCPQQGEQLLNARRLASFGFGELLISRDGIYEQAERLMRQPEKWDEELRRELTELKLEEFREAFERRNNG